jgi:ATP-dependent helicase HrpA
MLQIHRFWKDCKTRWESIKSPATPGGDTPLETYRWMIEEYRVSLYAQSLGTSLPVSEKRLEQIQKSMLP